MKRIILFWAIVLQILALSQPALPASKIPLVRVKVAESADQFSIVPADQIKVTCLKGPKAVGSYFTRQTLTVKIFSGKIQIEGEGGILGQDLDAVSLTPQHSEKFIRLNGKRYRGRLKISVNSGGKMMMGVNVLNFEDYLKGVVPLEMGKKLITGKKDREALKVQAVAARTYALSKLGQYPGRPYDVESTVADQVYGGADGEEGIITWAITKTKGEVLTKAGKLVKAYFHANCGGQTEAIQTAWPWKEFENYLLFRSDSDYCSWATNYTWARALSKTEAEKSITQFLGGQSQDTSFDCGSLQSIEIVERAESGRITLLKIITDRGEWEVRSDSIRWAFKNGPANAILPSTKFGLNAVLDSAGQLDSLLFNGFGNGHGVGMCQIGSIGRARAGQTYRRILAYYYPGTKLIKRY